MSDLVARVYSALIDEHPIWDALPPDAQTIVRLCLGCRSDKSAEKRLLALGQINQCLPPESRGTWNEAVQKQIQDNLENPTALIPLLTGKKQHNPGAALNETIGFYREIWRRFEVWKEDQYPAPNPGSIGLEESVPGSPLVSTASPVAEQEQAVKGFSPATLHEGDLYPGSPSLPWSTPRYTEYRGLEYFIFGGPPDPQSREYQFWYVVFTDKRPIQSAEAFSSSVAANFAARAAIDTLMDSTAPEPAPTIALKRGSKRGLA